MPKIPIAVDIMGGDKAPDAIIDGAVMALRDFKDDYHLLLVGDEKTINERLGKQDVPADASYEIIHSEDVIGMGEHPVQAIRAKPKCSINICSDLVRKQLAKGLFSAGNTGAAVGSSYLKWRMLQGLARPCIAAILPSATGNFLLLDAGATVDCSPLNLTQFAVMGDIYARLVMKIENPRIGLLSNGTEVGKGNKVTQDAFKMIREINGINFIGNIEGHDLFSENVDVVVCDGFVGNILLKSTEQLSKTIKKIIKNKVMEKTVWKLGGLMMKGALEDFKKKCDPSEVGGCPLLGVGGYCVIGHGNSIPYAVRNGIRAVGDLVKTNINDNIVEMIHEYSLSAIL